MRREAIEREINKVSHHRCSASNLLPGVLGYLDTLVLSTSPLVKVIQGRTGRVVVGDTRGERGRRETVQR